MSLVLEICGVNELCGSFGASETLVFELVDKFAEWVKLQPHLPRDISKKILKWFIVTNKLSLERAKQKLDMYYTMRRLIPEFYQSRNPRGPRLTAVQNQVYVPDPVMRQSVLLPKLTPGNYRTFLFRVMETKHNSQVDLWEVCKYIFMIADIRMIEDCCCGENIIIDLSGVSLSLVMKFTPSLLKKCQIAASNGYVSFVNGIYFINASSVVDNVLTLVKSVLHPKLIPRVHVYRVDNLEPFYEFVPKSILPKDYGGDEKSVAQLAALLKNKIDKWRDWFLDQEKVLVNEDLRPAGLPPNKNELFGFEGAFRKLEID